MQEEGAYINDFHRTDVNMHTFYCTMHIGYKAGVGTRENWPYNQYGLISDTTMEGPGEGLEGLV